MQKKRYHCKVPDAEIFKETTEQKIINLRNDRPFGKHTMRNMSSAEISTHSSNIVDALSEQVQSLRDAINVLEQRLTVLEEELRK